MSEPTPAGLVPKFSELLAQRLQTNNVELPANIAEAIDELMNGISLVNTSQAWMQVEIVGPDNKLVRESFRYGDQVQKPDFWPTAMTADYPKRRSDAPSRRR